MSGHISLSLSQTLFLHVCLSDVEQPLHSIGKRVENGSFERPNHRIPRARELFSYSPSRISCTVKHWKWQLPLFIQCFMYETCRHIENGSKASYINSLFALLGEQRKNNIQSKHNKYEHCDGTFFLVSLLLLLSFMFQGFCPHFFADVTSNSIALDLMNDIVCQTISINVLLYFKFIATLLFLLNSIQFDVISYLLVLFGCCSDAVLLQYSHSMNIAILLVFTRVHILKRLQTLNNIVNT